MRVLRKYLSFSFVLSIVFVSTIFSNMVFADDSRVDDVSISIPISCTMSGTGNSSHTTTITNGTYQANIGTTTLHAFCNDNAGFAIYATGYTNNTIGEANSNKLVGTNTSTNIVTGTATSAGNPDISNWAMKLAITQDSGDTTGTNAFTIDNSFNNYHVVPNEYTKVAHKNVSTDMTASTGGVKLTTTYAAYISKTQAADTYVGQVIYTLVHPASHAAPVICNPSGTTIATITCMQDISSTNISSILVSMTEDVQYALADKRDEKTYTVAKLKDGNIWMTKNLDLDLDSSKTYTNEDTDIGYNTTTGNYDTASWTPTSSTLIPSNGSSWVHSNTTPQSYDPGNLYWNGTESNFNDWNTYYSNCTWNDTLMVYENCNESLNPFSTYTTISGIPQYHLGNYYNWTAAIAMNNSSDLTDFGSIVEQSICPTGWTLPRSGMAEDTFHSLWREYSFWNQAGYGKSYNDTNNNGVHDSGENAIWNSPIYYSASGIFDGTMLGSVGDGDILWSAITYDNENAMYGYFFVNGDIHPSSQSYRESGYSIRCIARPVSSSYWAD